MDGEELKDWPDDLRMARFDAHRARAWWVVRQRRREGRTDVPSGEFAAGMIFGAIVAAVAFGMLGLYLWRARR